MVFFSIVMLVFRGVTEDFFWRTSIFCCSVLFICIFFWKMIQGEVFSEGPKIKLICIYIYIYTCIFDRVIYIYIYFPFFWGLVKWKSFIFSSRPVENLRSSQGHPWPEGGGGDHGDWDVGCYGGTRIASNTKGVG